MQKLLPTADNYRPFLLFSALVLGGLAANHFNYPLFFNIDFVFGSIFAMLALQIFGLGRGVLAAALIASYTYVLWNHPYAIVIMTVEVAAVGWLTSRRIIGMVLADALFWLFIGMPLVYLFYHVIMNVPLNNAYLTMNKQAVNGIANALIARLLYAGYNLRSRSARTSCHEIISNMLAFFVLCPALVMLIFASRADFAETDQNIRSGLLQRSSRVTRLTEAWITSRKRAIVTLAEMPAANSPPKMQSYLELIAKADPNFLRVGLLDRTATITAYYPLIDELGQKNIGKNFADRPFIPQLRQTLKPMLSEVVMGRVGIPKPMVTVLAPVVTSGQYGGYVSGILSLGYIQEQLDRSMTESRTLYTILDMHDRVIMTNRAEQTAMSTFVRGKGTSTPQEGGINQWIPAVPSNISISERWRRSSYTSEANIGSLAEWKLILEQPVAPFQKTLYEQYANHMARLFAILLGALVLAEFFSHRFIATTQRLRTMTQDLPIKLATGDNEFVWPESRIVETSQLIHNFREMAEALAEQFAAIKRLNQSLEQRVELRTKELQSESMRLQALLENASDGIHILDTEGHLLLSSPSFAQMLGYTPQEVAGLTAADWDLQFAPQELTIAIRELIKKPNVFETRHGRKDGSAIDVEINARCVTIDGQTYLYASARDITERKRLELTLLTALGEIDRQKGFLDAVINGLPIAVGVTEGPEHKFIHANPAYEAILPWSCPR